MKRIITAALVIFAALQMYAQPTAEECKARYERQVRNVGLCGLGVEGILDSWEKIAPEDEEMLYARFLYCFNKAQSQKVINSHKPKYLGEDPIMSLKDSTGKKVYYFQDTEFDTELHARSCRILDDLVARHPEELKYRFAKLASLRMFEKEDIVLADLEFQKIVDENAARRAWVFDGNPCVGDDFAAAMQECCAEMFKVGSDSAYESFRKVSEKLLKQYPGHGEFLDNIGSYWMSQKNYKKAISYYKKALKLNPDDSMAKANIKLAERRMASASAKK